MARARKSHKPREEEAKPTRNGLEPAYGQPGQNKYVVYCDWRREEFDVPKVLVMNFRAKYAAHYFLMLMTQGLQYERTDPIGSRECIRLENGIRVSMFGNDLHSLLNYHPTEKEAEWENDQVQRHVRNFRYGRELSPVNRREDDGQGSRDEVSRREKVKREKKEPKVKVDKTGMVTANDIASELGVEGREVRAVLRAMKLEKPEGGWAFDKKTAEEIREKVKKGLKQKAKKK